MHVYSQESESGSKQQAAQSRTWQPSRRRPFTTASRLVYGPRPASVPSVASLHPDRVFYRFSHLTASTASTASTALSVTTAAPSLGLGMNGSQSQSQSQLNSLFRPADDYTIMCTSLDYRS